MNIDLLLLLIPVIVPPIILWWRKWIEFHIGKRALPFAAIIIGSLCEIAIMWLTTGVPSVAGSGAILGAAGIGLREVVNQIGKGVRDWWDDGLET